MPCRSDADTSTITVIEILLYGSDCPVDTALNWAALVFAALCLANLSRVQQRFLWPVAVTLITGTLFAFQIGLCIAVGCAGVSIVWAALNGAQIVVVYFDIGCDDEVETPGSRTWIMRQIALTLVAISLLFDCGLATYYAVVSVTITTVAHLCAVVLGALLGCAWLWTSSRCSCRRAFSVKRQASQSSDRSCCSWAHAKLGPKSTRLEATTVREALLPRSSSFERDYQ
jgi:hypothetical protein